MESGAGASKATRIREAPKVVRTRPDYVEYTYTSFCYVQPIGNGRFIIKFPHVLVDPRGHFLMLRCAGIIVLDKIIRLARKINLHPRHQCRPWVELAEFLANFPVW